MIRTQLGSIPARLAFDIKSKLSAKLCEMANANVDTIHTPIVCKSRPSWIRSCNNFMDNQQKMAHQPQLEKVDQSVDERRKNSQNLSPPVSET